MLRGECFRVLLVDCLKFICVYIYLRIKFIRSLDQAVEDHDLIINKYKFRNIFYTSAIYTSHSHRPSDKDTSFRFTLLLCIYIHILHQTNHLFYEEPIYINSVFQWMFSPRIIKSFCLISFTSSWCVLFVYIYLISFSIVDGCVYIYRRMYTHLHLVVRIQVLTQSLFMEVLI